jgi:phage repressor protein C with HTH and peptisase S24 domain/DNA-binding XRE family transcriptional regulator
MFLADIFILTIIFVYVNEYFRYFEEFVLNLSEELKGIRKKIGKSQKALAEEFGLPQTTWASYETGKAAPPMKILFELAEMGYPIKGLTTSILQDMVDDGKIGKAELQKRLEIARTRAKQSDLETPIDEAWAEKADKEYQKQNPSDPFRLYNPSDLPEGSFVVPLLDQQLSAGPGATLPEGDDVKALVPVPSYLRQYGENIAALTVDGDSMDPTLHRGDMVVCDSCGWSGEGIYAIRMGGSGFVKRLTKAPGKVIIISDNPKYPPREELEGSEDFQVIGRVHCAIMKVE